MTSTNHPGVPATLSVVIPSYLSSTTDNAVEAVLVLRPEKIFVVDSSPQEPPPLDSSVTTIWSPDRMTPGAARNRGAESVQSDYILFVDSDVILTEEAIEFVREFLLQPDREIVSGVYRTDRSINNTIEEFQNAILRYRLLMRQGALTRHGSTSHLLISRQVFEEMGGFNPQLSTDEDMEFSARCLKLDHPLSPESRFEAIHLKPYTVTSLLCDNGVKTFDAFSARRRYPTVYKGFGMNLGPLLWLSLFLGCLLPLSVLNLFVRSGAGLVDLLVAIALLLSPTIIWPSVLRESTRQARWLSLALWPAIAWTAAAANLLACGNWVCQRTYTSVRGLSDWVRAGLRIALRNGMPVQIVHFITARCNLRCEHCFYKETLDAPNPGEISLESLEQTCTEIGPVLWYSLAGGEPYLRGDLVDVIATIHKCNRPKILSLPTNGWFVERTFRNTLRALERIDGRDLIIFFSLDGPEMIHDEIRGEGSFVKVKECMERLRPLQILYPNLYMNVITTVMPQNASVIRDFIDEIVDDFVPNSIAINLFRYHQLEHPPLPQDVLDAYDDATRAYAEHLRAGHLMHYNFLGRTAMRVKEVLKSEVISRIAREDSFVTPCTAGTLSYVINEDGALAACEILDPSKNVGSLSGTQRSGKSLTGLVTHDNSTAVLLGRKDEAMRPTDLSGNPPVTFTDLVRSERAKELRRWIRDTECRCTYECAMSTNTLFSWPLAGQLYRRTAKAVLTRQ